MYLSQEDNPSLELEALFLNITPGYNENLKSVCKSLSDYAEYTSRVRRYARERPIEEAVEKAIIECIQEGILVKFLSEHRTEAKKVSIYEYDQEKHLRMERRDAKAEGRNELLEELVKKKLQKNKSPEIIAEELEEDISVIQNIIMKITPQLLLPANRNFQYRIFLRPTFMPVAFLYQQIYICCILFSFLSNYCNTCHSCTGNYKECSPE